MGDLRTEIEALIKRANASHDNPVRGLVDVDSLRAILDRTAPPSAGDTPAGVREAEAVWRAAHGQDERVVPLSRLSVSPPPGWFTFGYHADHTPAPDLEFYGAEFTEDGLPLWERPTPSEDELEALARLGDLLAPRPAGWSDEALARLKDALDMTGFRHIDPYDEEAVDRAVDEMAKRDLRRIVNDLTEVYERRFGKRRK